MPDLRLQRTRTAYLTDRDLGDEDDYGSETPSPDVRCACGAGLNEPHAPECWRNRPSALAGATFDVNGAPYRLCGCWASVDASWTCAQHAVSDGMGV